MGTTSGGLPYPDPTDPVAEGADAIRALAEKLDIAGTYVPALTNITLGNGTLTGKYWITARMLMGEVVVGFNSTTTTAATPIAIGMPPGLISTLPNSASVGQWTAIDASASITRSGLMLKSGNNAFCRNPDGTGIGGTTPWVWANGDSLIVAWSYPLSAVPAALLALLEAAQDGADS